MNSAMSQNTMRKPLRLMRNEWNTPKKQNGKHGFTSKVGDIMAWVSVHDNVIGGKLRELAKEINCTQEEALGILVSLWLWGLLTPPVGFNIADYSLFIIISSPCNIFLSFPYLS